MQFIDLKQQYERIKEQVNHSVLEVLSSQQYIMGPEVLALEERLAQYTGRRHCISCANGTDALVLALTAYGIGPGDAVFVPSYTYFASAESISTLGATPIFVDSDASFNMDPKDLLRAIQEVEGNKTLRLGALMPVDLFGRMADYQALLPLAENYRMPVIVDAAQSFGAKQDGQMACSLGQIATTSFYPAKPLGCYGDGGAIFTDDDRLAELLRSLRIHGQGSDRYDNVRIGQNSRLDTLQAVVLDAKLDIFEEELKARDAVAKAYHEGLQAFCSCPLIPEGERSSWAQYTLLAPSAAKRDALLDAGKQAGIPLVVYYHRPMHMQTAYEGMQIPPAQLPMAYDMSQRAVSLPMHAYLSDADIASVIGLVQKVFST